MCAHVQLLAGDSVTLSAGDVISCHCHNPKQASLPGSSDRMQTGRGNTKSSQDIRSPGDVLKTAGPCLSSALAARMVRTTHRLFRFHPLLSIHLPSHPLGDRQGGEELFPFYRGRN